ncbi:hypothetical protein MNBD_GAMMA09-3179 [hydrothermal vent metagenome]|uniref:FHA domain-containing protein n=1 Tax=hydrothermal vent metagenome TaxID=652676 RepID=A0A3B0XWK5_9ZZZZ
MATLQISLQNNEKQEFPLDKENITIGRTNDNDICLDTLSVSGHHAKILTILNDSFIEDTDSTNGTYLNGSLIKKQALHHNDVIKIGQHLITYINDQANIIPDFEQTMIINPGAEGMPTTLGNKEIDISIEQIIAEIASSDSGVTSDKKAKVRITSGTNNGKELHLTKVLTTLGKPGVQVAAITRRPAGYFLIHIDSGENTEHSRVNDNFIGSRSHPLQHNDIIEVAGVKMEFFFE